MDDLIFQPGDKSFTAEDSPNGQHNAFFEDDAVTGYFYAVDLGRPEQTILDAVHIYNVTNVTDRNRPSALSIVWSGDSLKCALLINGYPHAVFDFSAKRGFCRTNYPNFPMEDTDRWLSSDHSWSDEAASWITS